MDPSAARQLRRVRTLGRGASGAVVWLASDDASGQLLAVKSAAAAGGAAAQLRREELVLEGLCSPHVVACLGSRAAAGGEHHLFLEFAPGGSLADEAARCGGRLEEPAIRAYARDMARGLAYLHGRSLVHGDVKARNVVIGGDGRARLTDFGCARPVQPSSWRPIGGTPAFMAPEVARGEEQSPAADVWAVACTVIEMATGRAPWSDEDDVFAAVHRIGYTDAVPELPAWLSAQAKDFLRVCLARNPRRRPMAVQLLEHPFLASACCDAKPAKHDWPSPNSTLNAAFWESDEEDEEASERAVERISSLARPWSGLSDWDSEEGWIEALDAAVVDLHVVVVEEGAIRFPTCKVEARDDPSKCQRHSCVNAGGNVGNFDEFSRCQCQSHSRHQAYACPSGDAGASELRFGGSSWEWLSEQKFPVQKRDGGSKCSGHQR
ncbi:mitogen-activated protein kinase kinase kinase 3-like [Panicum miliaceum]|uniref:Mitogen-activated protein kinase kinase kinase 3-like n=1 Tax=Panicum miliaceum TaxID=4540 RepID=A0A3L6SJ79_PANMI|nr:mitogen-activated protein kinase kinase kinase 3-like [Panicum miliaceum]